MSMVEILDKTEDDWYYVHDNEMDIQKKRRAAINKYHGMDRDRDLFDDGMEVQIGTHNEQNVPQHKSIKRFGPVSKGSAYVGGGGIQFDYDDSIISMKMKPSHKVIGGVHKMNTPKKMKLSVDFGKNGKTHDASKYKLDLDVHPEKFRINSSKIKGVDISRTAKKEDKGIDNLSLKLTGFMKSQKKKTPEKIKVDSTPDLDFSHVGITTGLNKKKLRGFNL